MTTAGSSAPAATAASARASLIWPKPAPRVEEGGPAGPGPDQALGDGHGAVGADPAAGQLAAQLVRRHTPELLDVGGVEGVGHGRAQPGPHDLGEGVLVGSPERGGQRIPGRAGSQLGRQAGDQVLGPEGEPQPASGHPDPTVAGPDLQVLAEQTPHLGQQVGRRRGVQRWLPMSTRTPSTSMLPAIPPTRDAASWTTTDRPARASRQAAISPAGPAPITTTSALTDAGRPPVLALNRHGPAASFRPRTDLRGGSRRGGYRWVPEPK